MLITFGRLRQLVSDRRGALLATTAIAMPVVAGFAGLGIEVGMWYSDKRDLQTAADAAALSGAFERVRGNPAGLQSAANYEAQRNGFATTSPNTIAVNNPPLSGARAGETTAVEVVLTRDHALLLTSLLASSNVTVAARSVAAVEVTGEACVLALDPTASTAVNNQGSATIDMTGCVMAANSNASDAINITGSATVAAYSLWTVGQVSTGNGSPSITLDRPATTNAWALDDPWANVTIPGYTACSQTNFKTTSGQVVTINPGVYCGGIDLTAQSVVTLTPGTYIINRGDFSVGGQTTVKCSCPNPEDGVTIILTSAGDPNDIGKVDISAGANVTLRAPSGPMATYRGLLFYQDRRAPLGAANANKFNGGASMNLHGAIYLPRQGVQFSGNNSATTCTQIVARTVTFTGNALISNAGCQAAGVEPVTVTQARLVE